MTDYSIEDIAKFWSYTDRSGGDDACWPWTRSRNAQGYGQFYPSGQRKIYAHRWILGVARGEALSREVVGDEDACHTCDNPPCVNPAHLYVGTRKDNVADAVERRRLANLKKDRCPRGHEYTFRASGARRCYPCEREHQREIRTVNRTHCKNGHEMTDDSVVLCKNGTRKCRECEAVRIDALRERLTAA